jgi:hypothetical protein
MDSDVEYFYNDALRWTFGFDNPNKAAVIFACLFPLAWLLWSLAWKIKFSWIKWSAVLLLSGIVVLDAFCLFKTYSRGGVAAALAAWAYLLWQTSRFDSEWFKTFITKRFCAGSILGILLVALFIWVGLAERSVEPITNGDASVSHRLVLWRAALEMAVDNPVGFGTGHSGEAYMQWYEPLNMSAGYRTMVNSYLTFLVEQGWLLSALILVIFLCFWFWTMPAQSSIFTFEISMGLRACIVAFLVSGLFSTIMEEPLLWIIPGFCTLALIIWNAILRMNFLKRKLITASFCGFTILFSLYVGGLIQRHLDTFDRKCGLLNGLSTVIEVGEKTPSSGIAQNWVIIPDEKILGDTYGQLLRQLILQTGIHLKIQDKMSPIPLDSHLLLVGEAVQATPISSDLPVVLLFPSIIPDRQAAQWIKSCSHLSILLPGIDEDGRSSFWLDCADTAKLDQQSVSKLSGIGLRIDWAWPNVIALVKKEK